MNNVDTVISGQSRLLENLSSHTINTFNERFTPPNDSIYKHHNWKGVTQKFFLIDNFMATNNIEQYARFIGINPVIIQNELIDAPSINGGTLQFKDP